MAFAWHAEARRLVLHPAFTLRDPDFMNLHLLCQVGGVGEHDPRVSEIILALNATVDGQTTAHYITDLLQEAGVKVTRLAHGVPVGGELDYLDEGTLSAAMRQRTLF